MTTGKAVGRSGSLGSAPETMVVSRDGSYLYAAGFVSSTDDHLRLVETTTMKAVRDPIPLGIGPYVGMAVSADGNRVYLSNCFGGSVSVIDTRLAAVVEPRRRSADARRA